MISGRHDSSYDAITLGYLYFLALLQPAQHLAQVMLDLANCCRFHVQHDDAQLERSQAYRSRVATGMEITEWRREEHQENSPLLAALVGSPKPSAAAGRIDRRLAVLPAARIPLQHALEVVERLERLPQFV